MDLKGSMAVIQEPFVCIALCLSTRLKLTKELAKVEKIQIEQLLRASSLRQRLTETFLRFIIAESFPSHHFSL